MTFKMIISCLLAIMICSWEAESHGILVEPVSRASAWRKDFKTPKNYNDHELYCGGITVQHQQNKGKCGPCGDNYVLSRPRPHENGGKYGTGVIVRKYKKGQRFEIQVDLSANHGGYFEFSLCPLNKTRDIETEECFAAHPIKLVSGGGGYRYPVRPGKQFNIKAILPANFRCPHCVFRWNWWCGNQWGTCKDGKMKQGCGPQETFRGCADISIL